MAVKPKKFVDKDGNQLSSVVHEKYVKDSNGNRLSDKLTELETNIGDIDALHEILQCQGSLANAISETYSRLNYSKAGDVDLSTLTQTTVVDFTTSKMVHWCNRVSSHFRMTDSYRIDCFLHGVDGIAKNGLFYSIFKLTYVRQNTVTGVLLGYIYDDGTMYNGGWNQVETLDGYNGSVWVPYIMSLFNESANQVDVVDNLTSDDTTKALSAKQGKVLNDNFENYVKRDTSEFPDGVDINVNSDYYARLILGEDCGSGGAAVYMETNGTIELESVLDINLISNRAIRLNAEEIYINDDEIHQIRTDIADNLTTDDSTKALSAKQGKVLNTNMSNIAQDLGQISDLQTTAKTSAVAAINELHTSIGDVETILSTING